VADRQGSSSVALQALGLWLIGIAVNLVIAGFYDVAVRDVAMAVSAFCLARLTAPATVHAREREMRPAEA
jgi:hypothetical protein